MNDLGDLIHNDPAVEIEASAMGITDCLHYSKTSGYARHAIARIAKTRGLTDFNAEEFGDALFRYFTKPSVQKALADFSGTKRQVVVVPSEKKSKPQNSAAVFPDDIKQGVPAEIIRGLDRLGLCFDVQPLRSSLAATLEQAAPGYDA